MNRGKVTVFSCVAAAALCPLLVTSAAAQAQAAPWSVVPSPSPGADGNQLDAVASVSASDVWAVGEATTATGDVTLTEQWNGTAWSVVPSPSVGTGDSILLGVAAVSATDVWAVGIPGTGLAPLIENWDGTSWSVVKAAKQAGVLTAVTAVSAKDIWAAGYFRNGSGVLQTLIEHWNGHKWAVVPSPDVGTLGSQLAGVTAVSGSDIWAVGQFAQSPLGLAQTLTLHWDGTSWSVVSSPDAGSGISTLQAAAAVSTADVWAVGESTAASGTPLSLIEQWNGTAWNVIANPGGGELRGIAAVSAGDIWAVGSSLNASGNSQTLIDQWNGTSWSAVPSPSPSASSNGLSAAAADPSSGQAWAVGGFQNASSISQTLTEFNP
jgi:hypothetical protein